MLGVLPLGVRIVNEAALQFRELLDLEARHDDVLRRLEDLDKRVAKVLARCETSEIRNGSLIPQDDGAAPLATQLAAPQ